MGVLTAIAAALMFGVSAPVIVWAGRGVGVFATACLLYSGAALVGNGSRMFRRDRTFTLGRSDVPSEKYTIEGARQKVDEHRKGGELRGAARAALTLQTLDSLETELKELIRFLSPDT